MNELSEFIAMGGYGAYVWSCVALCLVVLVWNVLLPLSQQRSVLRQAENYHQAQDEELR